MKIIKFIIKKVFRLYNYDREAERLIHKSVKIYKKGGFINKMRARRLFNRISRDFCCSFPPYVPYGKDMYIAHAHGIRIGRTASIGDRCKIYPYAAIVAGLKNDQELNEKGINRHAKIGHDCVLGYGCTIIGPITIGDDVTIGARAVVTKDVPPHTVVKNVNEFRQKKDEEIPEIYK